MKKIVAIIRQEKYQDVKNALSAVGCEGMNISEVKGRGSQIGIKESYRGSSYCIDLIPKTRIEIIAKDEGVDLIVDTSSKKVREAQHRWWANMNLKLKDTFNRSNVDSVSIRTDQDYVSSLMSLFAQRG